MGGENVFLAIGRFLYTLDGCGGVESRSGGEKQSGEHVFSSIARFFYALDAGSSQLKSRSGGEACEFYFPHLRQRRQRRRRHFLATLRVANMSPLLIFVLLILQRENTACSSGAARGAARVATAVATAATQVSKVGKVVDDIVVPLANVASNSKKVVTGGANIAVATARNGKNMYPALAAVAEEADDAIRVVAPEIAATAAEVAVVAVKKTTNQKVIDGFVRAGDVWKKSTPIEKVAIVAGGASVVASLATAAKYASDLVSKEESKGRYEGEGGFNRWVLDNTTTSRPNKGGRYEEDGRFNEWVLDNLPSITRQPKRTTTKQPQEDYQYDVEEVYRPTIDEERERRIKEQRERKEREKKTNYAKNTNAIE